MDETRIFQCACHDYHYLQIAVLDWNELDCPKEVSVGFVFQPPGFWEKLKRLFKKDTIWEEILLTKEQGLEMAAALVKGLADG